MTTYILGNGFDIAHDLDTSFESFRDYLAEKQSHLLYLFDGDYYWSDFEKNMCAVDYENYRTIHGMFNGIPRFVNSLFDDICEELFPFLNKNDFTRKKAFRFGKDDIFLNFNYTPTLFGTYDISMNNVYHIHGSIMKKMFDSKSRLILGHDESDYDVNPNFFSGWNIKAV